MTTELQQLKEDVSKLKTSVMYLGMENDKQQMRIRLLEARVVE